MANEERPERIETQLPGGHEHKDQEDVQLPGNVSKKRRTTIGELAQKAFKTQEVIEEPVERQEKELERAIKK